MIRPRFLSATDKTGTNTTINEPLEHHGGISF